MMGYLRMAYLYMGHLYIYGIFIWDIYTLYPVVPITCSSDIIILFGNQTWFAGTPTMSFEGFPGWKPPFLGFLIDMFDDRRVYSLNARMRSE